MSPTEILDRAASLARASKRVAIVAADTRQREVLRKGLGRRLSGAEVEAVKLFVVPLADVPGWDFDEVLVTAEASR